MRKQEQTEKPKNEIPLDFRQWWEPWGRDPVTGASKGGHPDAHRQWARKDEGRYTLRYYGISTKVAWATQHFRDEYDAWRAAGSPQKVEDFVSLAAPLERQKEFWKELKPILARIGEPMP